jgi:hypothetical protein
VARDSDSDDPDYVADQQQATGTFKILDYHVGHFEYYYL